MKRKPASTAPTFARRLTVLNLYGICARPAALFVKTASRFDADLTVSKGDNSVSGKSIMGLMTLEASQGSKLELRATGPDAKELIETLTELMNANFYSDEGHLPIPKEHSEWIEFTPPPPPPPEFRVFRVVFGLGSAADDERNCLVRSILPPLRQRSRPKHVRIRTTVQRTPTPRNENSTTPLALWPRAEPPRPFFLLLGHEEALWMLRCSEMPPAIADLRGFLAGHPGDGPLSHEETNILVRCYPWNPETRRYALRPDLPAEDVAIMERVFRRRTEYVRTHGLTLLQPPVARIGNSGKNDRVMQLLDIRKRLDSGAWRWAEYDCLESFKEIVTRALDEWIETEAAVRPDAGDSLSH